VIGEVELVVERLLDELEAGRMPGTYKSDKLHPMVGMSMPVYDLLKRNRYVNSTFFRPPAAAIRAARSVPGP
jgi:hypothetical protein